MSERYEPFYVYVDRVIAETDRAYLCEINGAKEWIPKSQIVDGELSGKDDSGEIAVPLWLAEEKGFG